MAWLENSDTGHKVRVQYGKPAYKHLQEQGYRDVTHPRSLAQKQHNQYRRRLGTLARIKAGLNELALQSREYKLDSFELGHVLDMLYNMTVFDTRLRTAKAKEVTKRKQNKKQGGG